MIEVALNSWPLASVIMCAMFCAMVTYLWNKNDR